ncbi:MAG: hypothetical protein ACFE0O_10045 [Opitutales bacterium]
MKPLLSILRRPARLFPVLLMITTLAGAPPLVAQSAEPLTAMLVLATPEAGPPDKRLARLEPRLRKIFQFAGYRQLDAARARVAVPGDTTFTLTDGHRLQVALSPADDRKVRAALTFTRGKQTLIRTTLLLQPGVPAILGGPRYRDGTLILVVRRG